MTGSLLHCFATLSAPAADLLVSSVWKGLVLVACVGLLLRCVPRLSAAARSAVWTAVLLATLLMPVLPFHASAAGGGDGGVVHAGLRWSFGLFAAWVVLSLLRILQLGGSVLRLRRIASRAVPIQGSVSMAALLARSRRRVTAWVSGDVSRPSVVGFFRPRILLPAGLLEELSAPELEHVVLHELEHLRRRDDWTNLLQKLSLALFPLHPALLWLDRRLCLERELACDDGVLRVTRARKAYAACLARLAEDSLVRRGVSLALGLLGVHGRPSELSGRVERILRNPVSAMSRVQIGAASAVLLTIMLGGSMLLARSPRLISFEPPLQPAPVAQVAPAPPGLAVMAHEQTGRAALVKAVMPQASPTIVRVAAPLARKPRTVHRETSLQLQAAAPAAPYLVFTEWHTTTTEQPRMTLTVAQYSQTPQPSQQTYAAVPVQGGWLLIQL